MRAGCGGVDYFLCGCSWPGSRAVTGGPGQLAGSAVGWSPTEKRGRAHLYDSAESYPRRKIFE